MNRRIDPRGCKDCQHAWADRCGLTGHKLRWLVNAPYQCQHFKVAGK